MRRMKKIKRATVDLIFELLNFELNNFWKEDDFFQIESKKSLIRALLRESFSAKKLLLIIIIYIYCALVIIYIYESRKI